MDNPDPESFRTLISPDAMVGVTLAVGASMVAIIRAQAGRWEMISSNIAAAISAAVVQPIAVDHGLRWSNYLGVVIVVTGVSASGAFLLIGKIINRVASRGDEAGDAVVSGLLSFIKRFLPKTEGK